MPENLRRAHIPQLTFIISRFPLFVKDIFIFPPDRGSRLLFPGPSTIMVLLYFVEREICVAVDLSQGSITRHLIRFTIPLILGNLFQLTYNAVDSIIIGRFAGDDALAAVGTADPVMNLMILGITGLCIGSSALMSNFYGAGDREALRKEMGTSLVLVGGASLLILFVGVFFSGAILRLMQTPEAIFSDARTYLRLILMGMPFTCLYNVYAASLRSVGDSKIPLYFLAGASVLNGVLDVLLIGLFRWGVFGAALATVLAEGASALACVAYVYQRVPLLHLDAAAFRSDRDLARQTLQFGGTTALQQVSQPLGKVFIQGMVNTLGVEAMAAFNAVGKIEDFALVPERSISNAMMTFSAQNDGAGRKDRVRAGFQKGLLLETCYGLFISVVMFFFHSPMVSLFSTEAETLARGSEYFTVMAFFYLLPAYTNGVQGLFRGMRHMQITLYCSILQISVRVLVTYLLIPRIGITGIAYACAAGWVCMQCLQWSYYFLRLRKELV